MRQAKQFKFENLQPTNFLKQFNKMIEQNQKNPMKIASKQLKVKPLNRFPIPQCYNKMQGIFQTKVRKNSNVNSTNKKIKDEEIDEQEFLSKHQKFMTTAIQKIVNQNLQHQKHLQSNKKYYRKRSAQPIKLSYIQSQQKLKRTQKSMTNSSHAQPVRQYQTIHKQQKKQQSQEANLTYLQKINLQRMKTLTNKKKQKFQIKNIEQVNNYISDKMHRQSSKYIKSSLHTSRVEYNNLNPEDKEKDFIQDLFQLQKQQNLDQRNYATNIQKQIKRFNREVKESVEKTRKIKFW